MAGGGLALMTVPPLTDATDWRAPYWSAIVFALAAVLPTLAATGLPRAGHPAEKVLGDRRLLPLGVLQAATFGLAVVAGNWAVTLLERQGTSSAAAGFAAGLILVAGIATRPSGGAVAPSERRRMLVGLAVCGVAVGAGLLLGLSAGLPFASIFASAQRIRPDAPAAAMALVNACAVLTILVGTPLAGLAFELPGDGRFAFAGVAVLAISALAALRSARL
jgi:hypothetical protein